MTYDELLAEYAALRALKVTHEAQLTVLQSKVEELAQELARLKRQSFGVKSERRHGDDKQTGLFAQPEPDAPPPEPEAAPALQRKATPHGRRRPEGQPDEVMAVPAPTSCTRCGGSVREISTSTATRLEWRRGHFVQLQVRRPSCACDQCNNVETAPEPSTFALSLSLIHISEPTRPY